MEYPVWVKEIVEARTPEKVNELLADGWKLLAAHPKTYRMPGDQEVAHTTVFFLARGEPPSVT